jgi:hypothetical protein
VVRATFVAVMLLALSLAGCSDGGSATGASAAPTEGSPASPSEEPGSALVGSWHRAQSCEEMLAAFDEAGLAESYRDWIQGNFYGGKPGPAEGDPCAGARGPFEHDHYFTASGEFGSHDQNGEQADDGDYELLDDSTVTFPSHAEEFGYDGDILVHFMVDGDVATFHVMVPEQCDKKCENAYAWALSAFASGPWESGEVPA